MNSVQQTNKPLIAIGLIWFIFQFLFVNPIFDTVALTENSIRSVHLTFGVVTAFFLSSSIQIIYNKYGNSLLIIIAIILCLFPIFGNMKELSPVANTILSFSGLFILLIALRNIFGSPVALFTALILVFVIVSPYLPRELVPFIAPVNESLTAIWTSEVGVLSDAMGISAHILFIYMTYGAILYISGTNQYFIQLAHILTSHREADGMTSVVIASALSGTISGSSHASVSRNEETLCPLHYETDSKEHITGVKAASSIYSQTLPPVMGAPGFLMSGILAISYVDVIKHALIPGLMAYAILYFSSQINGRKIESASCVDEGTFQLTRRLGVLAFLLTLIGALAWAVEILGNLYGNLQTIDLFCLFIFIHFVFRFSFGGKQIDAANKQTENLNGVRQEITYILSGFYLILPIMFLLWLLIIQKLEPEIAAYWSVLYAFVTLVTQNWFKLVSNNTDWKHFLDKTKELLTGVLVETIEVMSGLVLAMAVAGIALSVLPLTGVGPVLTDFVNVVSNGNILGLFIIFAVVCLLLGTGLPATASYLIVTGFAVPIIVSVGSSSGFLIPLVAVHLFVFYFAVLADITPPDAIAIKEATENTGADFNRSALEALKYVIPILVLPFIFIFDTRLLLIGLQHPVGALPVVLFTLIGLFLLVSLSRGYLHAAFKHWEYLLIVMATVLFLFPQPVLNAFFPLEQEIKTLQLKQIIQELPDEGFLELKVTNSNEKQGGVRRLILPFGLKGDVESRLTYAGIEIEKDNNDYKIVNVEEGTLAAKYNIQKNDIIKSIIIPNKQPPVLFLYGIGFLIWLIVFLSQVNRHKSSLAGISSV